MHILDILGFPTLANNDITLTGLVRQTQGKLDSPDIPVRRAEILKGTMRCNLDAMRWVCAKSITDFNKRIINLRERWLLACEMKSKLWSSQVDHKITILKIEENKSYLCHPWAAQYPLIWTSIDGPYEGLNDPARPYVVSSENLLVIWSPWSVESKFPRLDRLITY